MDLLVDEVGQVVVNQVHLGAGAEAGRKAVPWKERLGRIGVGPVNLGRLGYPIGAVLSSIDPPVLRLRVEVDGEVITDVDHPVLMVALGNGATVGGGLELTPDADPGDGRIDVMIARPKGTLSRLAYVARLGIGTHATHQDVVALQAVDGDGQRHRVLVQRRRGALRTRAAPELAARAGGVLDDRPGALTQ